MEDFRPGIKARATSDERADRAKAEGVGPARVGSPSSSIKKRLDSSEGNKTERKKRGEKTHTTEGGSGLWWRCRRTSRGSSSN